MAAWVARQQFPMRHDSVNLIKAMESPLDSPHGRLLRQADRTRKRLFTLGRCLLNIENKPNRIAFIWPKETYQQTRRSKYPTRSNASRRSFQAG